MEWFGLQDSRRTNGSWEKTNRSRQFDSFSMVLLENLLYGHPHGWDAAMYHQGALVQSTDSPTPTHDNLTKCLGHLTYLNESELPLIPCNISDLTWTQINKAYGKVVIIPWSETAHNLYLQWSVTIDSLLHWHPCQTGPGGRDYPLRGCNSIFWNSWLETIIFVYIATYYQLWALIRDPRPSCLSSDLTSLLVDSENAEHS